MNNRNGLKMTAAVSVVLMASLATAAERDRASQGRDPQTANASGVQNTADQGRLPSLSFVENSTNSGFAAEIDPNFVPSTESRLNINGASIPANGISFYADGTNLADPGPRSHNQPNQLCKIYTSQSVFDTDHGPFTRAGCHIGGTSGAGNCLEDFECTQNAAASVVQCLPVYSTLDCNGSSPACANALSTSVNPGCAGFPGLVKGIAINEVMTPKHPSNVTAGLLNMGPNWFTNVTRYVGTNFFTDSFKVSFPTLGACADGDGAPNVAGFNGMVYTTLYNTQQVITVKLTGGGTFVYSANGSASGSFWTGVACSDTIASIDLFVEANNGEGMDNLRFGTAKAPVVYPKVETSHNQLSDSIEALETAIANLKCDVDLTAIEAKIDAIEVKLDPPVSLKTKR